MTDIPNGYYAVPISDYGRDDDAVIGYQVIQRKGERYSSAVTYAADGVDLVEVLQWGLGYRELIIVVEKNPDTYREQFARLTGRCGDCGRPLTDPQSKARGIGPDCWARRSA